MFDLFDQKISRSVKNWFLSNSLDTLIKRIERYKSSSNYQLERNSDFSILSFHSPKTGRCVESKTIVNTMIPHLKVFKLHLFQADKNNSGNCSVRIFKGQELI